MSRGGLAERVEATPWRWIEQMRNELSTLEHALAHDVADPDMGHAIGLTAHELEESLWRLERRARPHSARVRARRPSARSQP